MPFKLFLLGLALASTATATIFSSGATITTSFPPFDQTVPVDPLTHGILFTTFIEIRTDSISIDDSIQVTYYENLTDLVPFYVGTVMPIESTSLSEFPSSLPPGPPFEISFALLMPPYLNPTFDPEEGFVYDIRHWLDLEGYAILTVLSGQIDIVAVTYQLEREGHIYSRFAAIPEPASAAMLAGFGALGLASLRRRPRA